MGHEGEGGHVRGKLGDSMHDVGDETIMTLFAMYGLAGSVIHRPRFENYVFYGTNSLGLSCCIPLLVLLLIQVSTWCYKQTVLDSHP